MCSQIAEAVKAGNYQFDTLVLSVSLPAQLCVREVSMVVCVCMNHAYIFCEDQKLEWYYTCGDKVNYEDKMLVATSLKTFF